MLTKLYKSSEERVEECYQIETSAPLSPDQLRIVKLILADGFVIETVAEEARIQNGDQFVRTGPRLSFETPDSSNLVTQCHACGISQITRIEKFFRHRYDDKAEKDAIVERLDRMTECEYPEPLITFDSGVQPEPVWEVNMMDGGPNALLEIDGLPFDAHDRQRYYDYFVGKLGRNPTCVEIFDLANADSDHSRHHAFKGKIVIDGEEVPETLMDIVRATWEANPDNSVIAFHDNASAIKGFECWALVPENPGKASRYVRKKLTYHILFTAETHNFPSGVAPYPGAETGLGGWIRDAVCAGRGSLVLFALAGYCTGRLNIPGYPLPWEQDFADFEYPHNLASGLQVAVRASDGVSDYGNCFGVPAKGGFFRSFGARLPWDERVEFVKPIVFVGGGGVIDSRHIEKGEAVEGLRIVQNGGPAYNVGFGGGAASSMHQGQNLVALDFDAVQRGDPEMERKTYEVGKACVEMGGDNPIISAHDQGAGGPGNVLKELVKKSGGKVHVRRIKLGDPTLSTLQIWVAEYQERFAYLIHPEKMDIFEAICRRENVNCENLGEVTGDGKFVVVDDNDGSTPVNIDLDFVLGDVPPKVFEDERIIHDLKPVAWPDDLTFESALLRVLTEPSVACKSWLVDKIDRHVLGRTVLQQGVGPLGLPLADCSITALSPIDTVGSVSALGEQPYKLLVDPAAGAVMAVAEMLTNMVWTSITDLRDIKCSANWMWAPKIKGERVAMYDAAVAVKNLMIAISIAIDGGKDSLSMATHIVNETVKSLRQLVISGSAPVPDIRKYVTPDIKRPGDSRIVLVDPSKGQARLGGSAFAHVYGGQIGDESPNIEYAEALVKAFQLAQEFIRKGLILSGHDRSDGGLAVTLAEMAFGGNCGLSLQIEGKQSTIQHMLAEEIGLVFEVDPKHEDRVLSLLHDAGVPAKVIGETTPHDQIALKYNGKTELEMKMTDLRWEWMKTSMHLEAQQSKADNPMSIAREKYETLNAAEAPTYNIPFDPNPTAPEIILRANNYPTMVLRDEGTNGYEEMITAAELAGLDPVNVHMTDLLNRLANLDDFLFLIIPGGFSHKDVPQSGKGFAAKIRFNERVWEMLQRFIERPNTLTAGICNGCQVNTLLGLVPWHGIEPAKQPRMIQNKSGMFESSWVHLRVNDSPSVLHQGMTDTVFGAWVAHGEGQFYFPDAEIFEQTVEQNLVTMQYVDHTGKPTQKYPLNPNGSLLAIAGLTTPDGRHTVCMPHPIDRSFYSWQCPWLPDEFQGLEVTPWLKMFQNAREWLEENK